MRMYIVPIFIAHIVSITVASLSQEGYSGFQVTGMIEWGQKSKPQKITRTSNNAQKKSLDQKLTPQKSHAEFPSLKNYQALHCKRYNPKDKNSRERGKKNLCRTTWPGNAGTTTNLHIFLNNLPPPPQKKKTTDKQTKKQKNKKLLTSYLKQATQCKKSRNRKLQTPFTGERPWKIVSLPGSASYAG